MLGEIDSLLLHFKSLRSSFGDLGKLHCIPNKDVLQTGWKKPYIVVSRLDGQLRTLVLTNLATAFVASSASVLMVLMKPARLEVPGFTCKTSRTIGDDKHPSLRDNTEMQCLHGKCQWSHSFGKFENVWQKT